MIENDAKKTETRRKVLRATGIVGAIISGICFLLMLLADDFSAGALLLFTFCVVMAIVNKK